MVTCKQDLVKTFVWLCVCTDMCLICAAFPVLLSKSISIFLGRGTLYSARMCEIWDTATEAALSLCWILERPEDLRVGYQRDKEVQAND